ncbi:MAG: IS110 family transposase [Rhodoplanes sp.]
MEYFAGLDVAMEETAICVVDREGKVVLETMITTDPDAIAKVLKPYLSKLRRVGHEAGSLSPWLQVELKQRGVPAICLEAWHARAALSAMRNKTDKADARGIAHIMRAGWFREVHIKSEESYRLRLVLTQRRNLKRKFLDIENAIRHSIKTFGLRIGRVGRGQFEARVRELVADDPLVAGLTDCMLRARAALWHLRLHKVVVAIVCRDELCRRFMRIPGVGPISALAFKTAIDDPHRFRHSKTVGAYLGLTSRRWQSGSSIDVQGHISRAGDGDVRHPLYEAANGMLTRYRGFCSLKAWGLKIAKTRGYKRACVAVARKLAVIMHAMWRDGSEFRFKEPKTPTDRTRKVTPKLIEVAA